MRFLKVIREQRNVSQRSLAEFLDVDENTVWRWEAGRSTPSVDIGSKIAGFLDTSVDELLNGPTRKTLKITIDWEVKDMSNIAIGGNEVGFGYRASDDNLLYWGAIPATSSVDEILEKIRAELTAAMAGRDAHVASKKDSK